MQLTDDSLLKDKAFINGEWVSADSGETLAVENPASGETITRVAACGKDETKRAIDAANDALRDWRRQTAKERAALLRRWYELVIANRDDLAAIMTAEQGKPLPEAKGEIDYAANYIEWFAEEAKRIYGDTIAPPSMDKRIVVIKQAIGVAACITPWNFPAAMLTRKIAPALAAGCTTVCKPANATPLSALAVVELLRRAGAPPGVVNIVAGKTREIGGEITRNPLVRKLTFTGSTEVGKLLLEQCAGTVKRTSMELGGNAPFIVFDDADVDAAVEGAMVSKYRNAGQSCVAANRIFVQRDVHDEFVGKFAERTRELTVGDGTEEGVQIGPLVDEGAAKGVLELVQDALDNGAKAVVGGECSERGKCFVEPTVLAGAHPDMRIYREEVFGPVAVVYAFDREDEVLEMANDTNVGLAAYFYARDLGRTWRVSEQLEYGMVGVNTGLISNEMAPFGGIKESGQGREGSKYGLDDYLEIKSLTMGGIDS